MVRNGLKDIWHARLVEGASWTKNDLPISSGCHELHVQNVISWPRAQTLFNNKMSNGETDFHESSHIHFFVDDQKFCGPHKGILANTDHFIEVAKHFDGVLGIDFSVYLDMPLPLKHIQLYYMRTCEYYFEQQGIEVVQNLRWSDPSFNELAFDGISKHSYLSIGTVASGLKKIENQRLFELGLQQAITVLEPKGLIIVGSANFTALKQLQEHGIELISFDSDTAHAFAQRGDRHV